MNASRWPSRLKAREKSTLTNSTGGRDDTRDEKILEISLEQRGPNEKTLERSFLTGLRVHLEARF